MDARSYSVLLPCCMPHLSLAVEARLQVNRNKKASLIALSIAYGRFCCDSYYSYVLRAFMTLLQAFSEAENALIGHAVLAGDRAALHAPRRRSSCSPTRGSRSRRSWHPQRMTRWRGCTRRGSCWRPR